MAEIRKKYEKIDFHNLTYFFKGNTTAINFIGFKGPLHNFKSIYSGNIDLEDAEKEEKGLKLKLGEISTGNPKNRLKEQDNVINNVTDLYESRQKVVQMFHDYPRDNSKRIYESKQGKGLQILTPKQMLKRLSIALAKISAENNSENLLNDVRQIVFSLYRSKEITKKIYNNIIKSIKV